MQLFFSPCNYYQNLILIAYSYMEKLFEKNAYSSLYISSSS